MTNELEEQEPQQPAKHLKDLGIGGGSKVEQIKANSSYLRGQIAEELAQPTTHFSEAQIQLLKSHGMYQQEDRDARQARWKILQPGYVWKGFARQPLSSLAQLQPCTNRSPGSMNAVSYPHRL